ncbi:hypothetical protein [Nonomuraea sp. NPDC049750]|uniref:hypothetical protein n=1 Tax=Nonomuraea sp. NPDC049750 TaxID=3154738 RepID=UPI0034055221
MTAKSNSGYAGGSFGYQAGKFDCSDPGKPANAYAYAYDTMSMPAPDAYDTMPGRYSARVLIQIE